MNHAPKILIVEDDAGIAAGLRKLMGSEGYDVVWLARGDEGLTQALTTSFDVVITDLKLPGCDGLTLVREIHQAKPKLPIILITAHGTTEVAIEATRWGAFDYVLKPFEVEHLLEITARALQASRLMSEPIDLGGAKASGAAIIGSSRIMQEVYKEIGRVAATPITVLIRGETGTGKELVARAIYQHSDRSTEPFVAVNCAAIPDTLLESELFGHEKGAFTGAETRRIGRFEQAQGGVLFLDEVGDLNANLQVKLLRVLQEKAIQRVGGKDLLPVDVRIIAATHCDLETAMRERAFREDLYYRLSVVAIHLPPLRQRKEDIPAIVHYFAGKYGRELGFSAASFQEDAIAFLQEQSWPGNVRELENTVRQALLQAQGYTVTLNHVQQVHIRSHRPDPLALPTVETYIDLLLERACKGEVENVHAQLLEHMENILIERAIRLANGNQSQVARWLGVSRLRVREKLRQLGLHLGDGTPDE